MCALFFRGRGIRKIGVLTLLTFTLIAPDGFAIDLRLVGRTIYLGGEIEQGDAARLAKLIDANKLGAGLDRYTVNLNSPGGSLLEGIRIGKLVRAARLETLVKRNATCASACALAFLGGTRRYATGQGIGRRMEYGASLGFHGFRSATESVRLENETLSIARIFTGLILEYAAEMKRIDLGWLGQAITVSPAQLRLVRTPEDISALSIDLEGLPSIVPKDWYINVCRRVVTDNAPALESAKARVLAQSEPIPTIRALRNDIVSARFGGTTFMTLLAKLPNSEAIDLALGYPFDLKMRKPILDARSVDLDRGAGFYFDKCLAIRTRHELSGILIDKMSHLLVLRDFGESGSLNFRLAMFDERTPLW